MQLIKSVEIKYLRSIHRLRLSTLGDLTVFSGANDVGKSNLLRSLNLFFNNEVDWRQPIDFYQDFSLRRLDEVRRESIKGKQFISISLQFQRPPNYQGSLPPTFQVTRTWLRDSTVPQESNDLDRQEQLENLPSSPETARRMLSQLLNRTRFEYIPAIKDREYFAYILSRLQETLLARQMQSNDPILQAVRELNNSMGQRAGALREDFEDSTGIEANVSLPVDPTALFRAFSVSTKWSNSQEESVPLTLRGDGIQARYIPSLLGYIAGNSRLFHIWGFEEPENSVEYNLAIDLAHKFEISYIESAQIFVTSHSPAFVSLQGPETVCYRVYKVDDNTEVAQLHPSADEAVLAQLAEDIGPFRIQEQLHQQYLEQRDELVQSRREIERLRTEIATSAKPVVYVEGKTDAMILKTAWEKLYGVESMSFNIRDCDPLTSNGDGGAAGCDTLGKLLSTVRVDNPNLVIGIFDRDSEGMKAYKELPAYFEEATGFDAKISRNYKVASLLLPVPVGKEEYVMYENLHIEFLFGDQALERRTPEGLGLEFRPAQVMQATLVGGRQIKGPPQEHPDLLAGRSIVNGKTVFARDIVPNLELTEFENFRLIFDRILAILTYLQDQA